MVPHKVTDQLPIASRIVILVLTGILPVTDAGSLHHGSIIPHRINEAHETIGANGELLPAEFVKRSHSSRLLFRVDLTSSATRITFRTSRLGVISFPATLFTVFPFLVVFIGSHVNPLS
jgi:hypothetical protein